MKTQEEIDQLEEQIYSSDLSHLVGMTYKDGLNALIEWLNESITTEELLSEV